MDDSTQLFNNLFLVNEPSIVTTKSQGMNWLITLDPKRITTLVENRLNNKMNLYTKIYPDHGITFEYLNDDNTYGSLGNYNANVPKFF